MIDVDRFFVIFTSIVYEALPFIIIGALISGTLEELLPQQFLARVIPKRRSLAIAISALMGMVFPMCECGIVPVMRRLLGKGLPLSCAIAYMLAAPIINPVVIGSTWAAFSGDRSKKDGLSSLEMVTFRVSMGFITAFVAASVVEAVARRRNINDLILIAPRAKNPHFADAVTKQETHQHVHGDGPRPHHHEHHRAAGHASPKHGEEPSSLQEFGSSSPDPVGGVAVKTGSATQQQVVENTGTNSANGPRRSVLQRVINISDTALHDFVDITTFLILGAILASLFQTLRIIDYLPVLEANPLVAIPVMMLVAVILCLCSEADAFVVANMIPIPLGGKLSFLVLGPMMDIKLYLMYTRVFRTRLIWTIIPVVVACVFVLSIIGHYLGPILFP
ncbi:MAG: permease [Gemmatales bacterium]|nr:permease [Gemmatales bacterium]MDW8386695.1 permease [Gemmatales bacterium]